MMLSRYFSLSEMTVSQEAARRGLDNNPPPEILENLKRTAGDLDSVREAIGCAIHVSSGYRSPQVNQAVGGAKHSAHLTGLAVDFIAPKFGTPLELAKFIERMPLEFDQLIHEYGRWVHLGFAGKGKVGRRQLLTIDKHGTRPGLHA
jgi:zinc D-Ala-D-Ala carboxypeptidase